MEYGVCPHCGSSDLSSNTGAEWQCVACGKEWVSPELRVAVLEEQLAVRDKIIEILDDLVVTLPQRMRDAESSGTGAFVVMVWGYEVCYYLTEDGWRAYLNDTAD